MRPIDADELKKDLTRFYDNEVTAKRLIDEQPTIEPEPHWIPCSERLPEPCKAVLGYAPRYQNIYALYYDSAYGWMIWNPLRDDCFPNSQGEIVAWMPLPEPYREEGD
jgi:hypothetical protein